MKRDNYECQDCKRKGKVTLSNRDIKGKRDKLEVHHIKELYEYPELALVDSNLITLCISCHNERHERFKFQKRKKYNNIERW